MEKILTWIKANILLAVAIGLVAIVMFFPKLLKGLISSPRRRRVHYTSVRTRSRRRLPRSVGLTRRGVPRKQYTKGGKAKKPWQIKGSEAARRHMARLRKMR
jgi:hypothetical protein